MKNFIVIAALIFSVKGSAQGKFYGGNGDGFATASLANVVLPLEEINFTGTRNGQTVNLQVIYSSSAGIKDIVLERGTSSTNFLPFDSVVITFDLRYSGLVRFADPAATEPVVYYRLKLTNLRGEKTYSKVLSFRGDGSSGTFTLLSSGNQIQYSSNRDGDLEIISSTGQAVQRIRITKGSAVLNIPQLRTGVYILRFENEPAGKFLVQ